MIKLKSRKQQITTLIGLTVLFIGILFFLLRGPYLSNYIKRLIIPTLENTTRERIIIDKAVINLFPFYIQAKGFKLFDKDGNRLLWITKSRAYIDLLGLVSKELRVRKLTLKEPALTANEKDLRRIMKNVRESASVGEEGKFRVSLKNIKLTDGSIEYSNAEATTGIKGSRIFLDMSTKNKVATINFLLKRGKLRLPNNSELKGKIEGQANFGDGKIEIEKLKIRSSKSKLVTEGEIFLSSQRKIKDGSLSIKTKIYTETINSIFGLRQKRDSVLSFKGSVNLLAKDDSKWPKFKVDLTTNSMFYLESLMEILEVDKNIKGKLNVNGKIKGTFPKLSGKGTVQLERVVLGTLPLDDVTGKIKYQNKKFSLNGFTAHSYSGKMKGDAHILIPNGDYSVTAGVSGVSSPEFFKFIKWEPPFPRGRINGDFQLNHSSGRAIEVLANVNYTNTSEPEGDVLGRLKRVSGNIEFRDSVVSLEDSILSTSDSDLFLEGSVDLKNKKLSLDMELDCRDVNDLTAPYYTGFTAPLRFKGKAKGFIDDPEVSGNLNAGSGSIQGLMFSSANSDFTYRISSLAVERLRIEKDDSIYDVSGSVEFRKAKELFSFKDPFYKAKISVKNADIKPFIKATYKDIPVSGFVSGLLLLEGEPGDVKGSGDLVFNESVVFDQELDKVIVKATLHPEKVEFRSVTAAKGESSLAAKGTLFFNKDFTVALSSNGINSTDIAVLHGYHVDAFFSLDLKGSGTIENPDILFNANVIDSKFRGIQIGKGEISGGFKDKKLFAKGKFLEGKATADTWATFSGKPSWAADIDFKKGRYEYLLSGFLRDAPRDLSVFLEGEVRIEGQDNEISMRSKFGSVDISLYNYNFRNNNEIVLELTDKKLMITSFSFKGDNAEVLVSGDFELNENYNISLKGNVDIAPLHTVTDKIESLKGQSSFIIDISGPWDNPDITGEINVNETAVTLAEFPYRIGPLNGIFFLNKDRITFESVRTNFASGTIVMSGVGYFKKLNLERLFISAVLDEIKIRPMERVNVAFNGRLFYETSSEGSSLSGNIDIEKAKYEKKVEFDNLLLGLKEMNKNTMEYPAFLGETELNVRISGSDNILIDNNIAKTPVNIDINVMGTVTQYGLIGRIEANEGNIYFRSNEFKILQGSSVEFVDINSITPVFHILAETFKSDYYINLTLDGTTDQFTLSLFSDPPLSEMDILTLLTFGQIKGETRGFESGIAASEAASILTGDIQESFEEEFMHITGFERFKIEPHTTTAGAFSPKVTIGKRLIEDKLSVIYSSTIGTTEEHVIKLQYNLNKNVSVVGSRNERGSAGAGLKYRFEFK
jgi:translocation and assembly module TamB